MIHKPKLGELAKRLECVRLAGALARAESGSKLPHSKRWRARAGLLRFMVPMRAKTGVVATDKCACYFHLLAHFSTSPAATNPSPQAARKRR